MHLPTPLPQLESFERFLHKHFAEILPQTQRTPSQGHSKLLESICYSLFSGGKRFRPSLGFLLSEALDVPSVNAQAWLAAIECIHTYSLIHDDLPSMDNDSQRRGKPTNHIVYGETTALLAGDALLTEAFTFISQYYSNHPEIGLPLVQILSKAAGIEGMVGGQALDLASDLKHLNRESIQWIQQLKTGALIQAVAEGIAVIARLPQEQRQQLKEFGALLGLAFQLKDDLLDYDPSNEDYKNITSHLGLSETQKLLEELSQKAQQKLQFLTQPPETLKKLVLYNISRSH